jgi:hypothetical protein
LSTCGFLHAQCCKISVVRSERVSYSYDPY